MRAKDILNEDWQKVNKKDKTDGMSQKAVKAYRRENPGSKLKTAVTTKPSKLKKGSKSAKRRKSFCSRMSGMKKAHASAKTKRDPNSPINKALRRWNCESIEQVIEQLENQLEEAKKKTLKNSNPCWKGYHPVGTKKKGGRTVPNCVPNESIETGLTNVFQEFVSPGGAGGGSKVPRNPGKDPWGNDGPGEDPYQYPKPEHYPQSIDFFGKFEADHFDKEDFDEKTGVFKGYWDYDGKLKQIAYFKFDNPQRNGDDDPGMGWYYEPDEENMAESTEDEIPKELLDLIDEYIARVDPDADRDEIISDIVNGYTHPDELEYALQDDELDLKEGKTQKQQPPKPRNFVAKNATTSGAGAHKDKKKAVKQGDVKHKGRIMDLAEMEDILERASRQLCKSSKPDKDLGASNLASCKSQGYRARDGEKSHLITSGSRKVRIKVGGKRIKGKKYGGPLPDYGTRKGQ